MSPFKNSTLRKSQTLLAVIKALYTNVAYKYPIEDEKDIEKQKDSFTKLYNLARKLEEVIDSYVDGVSSLDDFKEDYTQCEYSFQRIYDNDYILSAFYDITGITRIGYTAVHSPTGPGYTR